MVNPCRVTFCESSISTTAKLPLELSVIEAPFLVINVNRSIPLIRKFPLQSPETVIVFGPCGLAFASKCRTLEIDSCLSQSTLRLTAAAYWLAAPMATTRKNAKTLALRFMLFSSLTFSECGALCVEFVLILRRARTRAQRFRPAYSRRTAVRLIDALLDELVPTKPRYGFESQSLGREGQMG